MQLCCPACSVEFPIEAGFADAEGKRLAAALAVLDAAVGRALIGYLRLHKPAKNALRLSKAQRIVEEVQALVTAGFVQRDAERLFTTPAMWAQGIEQLLSQRAQLRLPLSGHGYLEAIVIAIAIAHQTKTATTGQTERTGTPPLVDNEAEFRKRMAEYGAPALFTNNLRQQVPRNDNE